MDSHFSQGTWVPLLDYANQKGVSISTLRRYIKAEKIQYKFDHGRYLIYDTQPGMFSSSSQAMEEVAHLRHDLQKAREEIAELKTLIALYEEQVPQNLHT